MSRGLGQFERWIIVHTYLKTVLRELPPGWKLPAGCRAAAEGQWMSGRHVWDEYLSRAEILLNRFGLATSDRRKPWGLCHQCFRTTPAYRSAMSNLSRVLSTLSWNEYIQWDPCTFAGLVGHGQWDGIRLTKKGLDAAEKLSVDNGRPTSG